MIEVRTCTKCKQNKNINLFYKECKHCKECRKNYLKEWQEKNKEKIKKQKHEKYETNKNLILKKKKEYRNNNKEKIREQRKIRSIFHKEKRKEYHKNYWEKNKIQLNEKQRIARKLLRLLVFSHYGNKCAMCGNTFYEHLTIDHINNDGYLHRKKHKTTNSIYINIKNQNFPKDKYQILCWNCNLTKTKNTINSKTSKALLQKKIISILGAKCSCCGETNIKYLTIDHIHGGGNKLNKTLGAYQVLKDLLNRNVPKDEIRILCYNCNCSRGAHGYCPHRNLPEDRKEQND